MLILNPIDMTNRFLLMAFVLAAMLLAGPGCRAQGVTLEPRSRAEIDVRPLADVQSYVQLTHAAEYHGRYYCRFWRRRNWGSGWKSTAVSFSG